MNSGSSGPFFEDGRRAGCRVGGSGHLDLRGFGSRSGFEEQNSRPASGVFFEGPQKAASPAMDLSFDLLARLPKKTCS